MTPLLTRKLLEKGAITRQTHIEVFHNAHGLSCLDNARVTGHMVVMSARGIRDPQAPITFDAMNERGEMRKVSSDDVIRVDGMEIERLARMYGYYPEGTEISITDRKKRRDEEM